MKNKEPEEELFGIENLFGEDEVMLNIEPQEHHGRDLALMDGIAYMTEVATVLKLSEHHFRLFAAREERKGVDTYAKYGLRKDVGKWKVNLQRFFDKWNIIKKHMQLLRSASIDTLCPTIFGTSWLEQIEPRAPLG